MVPFRLTCLGPPELHGPDGDPIRFRTRKHFALLIYLAVESSLPHRRDRLATLLWSNADVGEARHSLATALSLLRGRLGPDGFETTRDTVRLLPKRVATDLADVEHDDPADPNAAPYGPFLEEFDVLDAPDFQHWKDVQHAQLVPRLHETLARRIEYARRHGDSRRMETVARRLERVDDLSEEGVRAMVESRAMAGDRIGGLRVFDRWRTRLADQLGASPSPLLERMSERLRRNAWERPSPALVAPVPTAHWKERNFVGRSVEFGICYGAWERVRANEPRHVLVRGESGIGKTTLVERFVTAVALEGASAARVQCYELERELPFGMIGGLVTHLLDLPGASATPPEQLAELGRLIPKVRQRYPSLPAPLPSVGESARILFTEAVMALVAALAEEQPVVLVVDDMHLADVTSLAVLHLILRRVDRLPLMVLLTSSSDLGAEAPGAQRFVDHADSIGMTVLRVGPLPGSDTLDLLDALVAQNEDPGPTIRRAIVAGALGNPMVLELLVADWRRRGKDCLALSLGAMTPSAQPPPREAFRRLVDGTLAALDPETRAVAELAAILGQRLNDLSMYTLVDLPVARTMRAMTTLAGQRVFRDAGTQLEFSNEFVRGQCYVAMAAPLRRMLHGLVADRLLAQDGADEPIPGLETAWHLVRADRLAEAVPYLLAGGRESIRRGAPHEADLALSTGLPALTGEARRTAILLLAEAMQELGRWADSLQLLDTANEPFSVSEECCRDVFRIIAKRWLYLNATAMNEAVVRLCDIAHAIIDVEVRVKALSALPYVIADTRNMDDLTQFGLAINAVEPLEMDGFQRLHLLMAKAWRENQLHNSRFARDLLDEAVDLMESTGAAGSIAARILIGAGVLRTGGGAYEESIPLFERAIAIARRIDNPLHLAAAAASLAMAEGRLGRTLSQLKWASLAIKHIGPGDGGIIALGAIHEKALALAFEQRYGEAQSIIAESDGRFGRDRPSWVLQAWLLIKADILALAGSDRKAITLGRQATTGAHAKLLADDFAGPFSRWTALVAMRDGKARDALNLLSERAAGVERYHAKDQVEWLAAVAMLQAHLGLNARPAWAKVEARLKNLPPTIGIVMRRLGTARDATSRPGSIG